MLLRDEVPNVKLSTLAAHFRATTTPNHRALSDARATVDVLHGLLERIGNLGAGTIEDLFEFTRRVSPERRAKRGLAKGLPAAPGIYQFIAELAGPDGRSRRQVLYVGKSRNLRKRVATYFTAAETRPRIDEMVRIATGVETTVCRTPLEADVLELRLIAAHSPRYNRRSKFPERQVWLKLTVEPFPRLSIVRAIGADAAAYFGPFRRQAGGGADDDGALRRVPDPPVHHPALREAGHVCVRPERHGPVLRPVRARRHPRRLRASWSSGCGRACRPTSGRCCAPSSRG